MTAFYYDHGIDYRFATWETFRRSQTVEVEILETDPLRIRLTVPCGDDRLRLTLDERLAVVEVIQETARVH